jgi:hypothetical protein
VCCQDLSDRTAWADFDYFNYESTIEKKSKAHENYLA